MIIETGIHGLQIVRAYPCLYAEIGKTTLKNVLLRAIVDYIVNNVDVPPLVLHVA